MDKAQFLKSLEDCYTRLALTEHGVGVRAIRPIPKGTDPFLFCPKIEVFELHKDELTSYPEAVVTLVKNFCAREGDVYYVPKSGIDAIGKNYYLNHSSEPNMVTPDEGLTFIASRDITEGEELTVDYRTYSDGGSNILD